MLKGKFDSAICAREGVPVEGMAVQCILRNAEGHGTLIVTNLFNVTDLKAVITEVLERRNDCLGRAGCIGLGLLMAFPHLDLVSVEGTGELLGQILQSSLKGNNLLGHVGSDDGKVLGVFHIVHELVAIATSGSHNERDALLGIEQSVAIHGRRMGEVNGQKIVRTDRCLDSLNGSIDLILGAGRDELHAGRLSRDGVDNIDGGRFDLRTSHCNGGKVQPLAQARLGGGGCHWSRHAIDHNLNAGKISTHLQRCCRSRRTCPPGQSSTGRSDESICW
mmetsp:Transcript_34731/g.102086  ORF Transcript_34731/g.102086 Transcript_34731/m.102086 type:complete len:277 (-) Transcript_34731:91-921(-)